MEKSRVTSRREPAEACALSTGEHHPLGVKAGSGGREAKKNYLLTKDRNTYNMYRNMYSIVVALQFHKGRLPGWPGG